IYKTDNAVLQLNDGAGGRTSSQAARIYTVHALVFGHIPEEPAVPLDLVELDHLPEVGFQIGKGLIATEGRTGFGWRQVVPLLAAHFAGLAADARGNIDQLGNCL